MRSQEKNKMQSMTGAYARVLLGAGLALALGACEGVITTGAGGGGGGGEGIDPSQMTGAGGRDISEYWPSIDIPLSQNTRMLSFEMMRNEVQRATGRSWVVGGVDMWEANRGAFGGADYVSTFVDDLTPSQQRIVLWRKMAFQVCGDLVQAESGQVDRTVFADVDPGAPLVASSEATDSQVRALFRRFFLTDAEDIDVTESLELLQTLSPDGQDSQGAWQGLCATYLGSMRFVTY